MTELYIPYPDVMSKEEIAALQQLKQRQVDRINGKGMRKVKDDVAKVTKREKFYLTNKLLDSLGLLKEDPLLNVGPKKEPKKEGKKRMRNPIDMYGNTIKEGHYINYPCRKGSDTYMRTAKVIRVRERTNHLDNVLVVLDVVVAIAPRAWERKGNWEQNVITRKVTVSCPYRATIVPASYIKSDKRYRTLLEV